MRRIVSALVSSIFVLFLSAVVAHAQSRIALVIANSSYQHIRILPTPSADADIMAETLRGAGYDVTELKDLRGDSFGQPLRDFLDKIAQSGPATDVIFYYSGFGVQYNGDNFLIPVDSNIVSAGDVTAEAFRLSDLIREIAALPSHSRVIILDASRRA